MKFLVLLSPGLPHALQVAFLGADISLGAVTLGKLLAALAPAVIVFAHKLAFSIAAYVT